MSADKKNENEFVADQEQIEKNSAHKEQENTTPNHDIPQNDTNENLSNTPPMCIENTVSQEIDAKEIEIDAKEIEIDAKEIEIDAKEADAEEIDEIQDIELDADVKENENEENVDTVKDENDVSEENTANDLDEDDEQSSSNDQLIVASEILPQTMPIIPILDIPLFPKMLIPLVISDVSLQETIDLIDKKERPVVGIVLAKDSQKDLLESELYEYGTAARVHKISSVDEEHIQIMLEGLCRIRKKKEITTTPVIHWDVEHIYDTKGTPDDELKAHTMAIISSVKELLKLNPLFQEQLKLFISHISYDDPGPIMDLVSSMTTATPEKRQELLETLDLTKRAQKLLILLQEEIQLAQLQEKIRKSIENKISQQQKEFFLREQLKAIKKELGLEKDDKTADVEKFEKRLEKLTLSQEAREVYDEELDKFKTLERSSPEYHVCRNYLDWMTLLPWGVSCADNLDIKKAEDILNADHYGLEDAKERILEFLSLIIKTKKVNGGILCFVGPPGVGKTSIGKSIAKALGRKFYRFSVGGMRDEAEIKGHRRTYIGAMPGKIIQCLKTLHTNNPVIMLDEIDKIGTSFRGDPASALLEVLDPEQNQEFLDHFLDVRFDLSSILFITTANQLDTIPAPLLDRMEIINLSGYILDEKLNIARDFLIKKQLDKHGLQTADVSIGDDMLRFIIDGYAREAGVRNLEKNITKIMRKVIRKHAEGDTSSVQIKDKEDVIKYLKQPPFTEEELYNKDVAGVALGLAWTSLGGKTLYIEASAKVSKSGGYKQTGQLGKVMEESSHIAYSYICSQADKWGINTRYFDNHFIHLHVPAGATPKDGPSAGITMATALYSLVKQKPVRSDIAMTGELTLTGKVLPIGGVKEKVIAAKRVGITQVILPLENKKDYDELPQNVKDGVSCHFADYFSDVLQVAFAE
ncbi:endopeptidase La [Candidatus Uabimicrobium amorphum]|uniref:Lon protease n=1 Tax=Uabimicrobium amorphum TaxID=2596890 RepID=A0A5S9F6B4_UABAM|nr:endopeptidase La [Candidatus Uabimicrobium amorphum]BBM87727.1 Lon protease [Candidatus Uabimicrobium amorphum]